MVQAAESLLCKYRAMSSNPSTTKKKKKKKNVVLTGNKMMPQIRTARPQGTHRKCRPWGKFSPPGGVHSEQNPRTPPRWAVLLKPINSQQGQRNSIHKRAGERA
jgi:hypothetical protein